MSRSGAMGSSSGVALLTAADMAAERTRTAGTYETFAGAQGKADAAQAAAASALANHKAATTDHSRLVVTDALGIPHFSGAVTDALFATTPPNGAVAIDDTNSRLYTRINGTWAYVAISGAAAAFSPANITNLFAWWDASQITGLNDGDSITSWPDLSGNGRNLGQSTGAAKPIYRTAQQNGKAVARFAGAQYMFTSGVTITQPYTIFLVARPGTGTDQDMFGGGGPSRLYVRARSGGNFTLWSHLNPSSVGTLLSTGANDGTARVFTAVIKGGDTGGGNVSRFRVNGAEITSDAMGIGVPNNFIVGSSATSGAPFLTGDVMEAGVYNRELTTGELLQLESYLA